MQKFSQIASSRTRTVRVSAVSGTRIRIEQFIGFVKTRTASQIEFEKSKFEEDSEIIFFKFFGNEIAKKIKNIMKLFERNIKLLII